MNMKLDHITIFSPDVSPSLLGTTYAQLPERQVVGADYRAVTFHLQPLSNGLSVEEAVQRVDAIALRSPKFTVQAIGEGEHLVITASGTRVDPVVDAIISEWNTIPADIDLAMCLFVYMRVIMVVFGYLPVDPMPNTEQMSRSIVKVLEGF